MPEDFPKGAGPARNFAWEHALSTGAEYHWVMDDNIRRFHMFNRNTIHPVKSPLFFRIMENFVTAYENIHMAGPEYLMFMISTNKYPKPYVLNARIFSCNLIRNGIPLRWRGRWNEDLILSLDVMEAGGCTTSFKGLLQEKSTTMSMKGGNTDSVYQNGTFQKSMMAVKVYPQYCKITKRYGRWHHKADFSKFKKINHLVLKKGTKPPSGTDDYGLRLSDS